MRRIVFIVTLCAGCWLAAGAQTTFTDQLRESKAGEGKVTVTQDKSIDDLINNTAGAQTSVGQNDVQKEKKQEKNKDKEEEKKSNTAQTAIPPTVPSDTATVEYQKKVLRGGHKINGYRVQIFAGGNSRSDRIKAERIGDEIKSLFPTEPVYVHFYSPRWICRMGNYRTYEEAHEMLRKVKNLNYKSAIIVKGKIIVQYL